MKITIEDLMERIHIANKEDLVGMMTLIVRMKHSDSSRKRLESIILGDGRPNSHYANIALDRTVTIGVLKDLAVHPIMKYAQALIESAMEDKGPYQSREVLVNACMYMDEDPYYITQGVQRKDLTMAGYILSMAGLERRSHFDKARRMPIKAWKPRRGTGEMNNKQRFEMVKSIIKFQLQPIQSTTIHSLGELI